MLGHLIRFELRYHFSRVSTYVFIAIWLALSFLTMTLPEGGSSQFVDNPTRLAQGTVAFSLFGVIVIAAICGMAVCRDFELNVHPLIFTRPIRRRDYLAGRLVGSILVCAVVFAAIPIGLLAGSWMPWVDRTTRMPFRVWPYLQPYLLFTLPTVVWAGTLFFAIGALTRRITVVYLQGVAALCLYALISRLIVSNPNDYWLALIDPFAMATISHVTRYWTIVETNALVLPVAGVVLANRAIWMGVGLIAALAVFRFFPFSVEALTLRRRVARQSDANDASETPSARSVTTAVPRYGTATTLRQLASLTCLHLRVIVSDLVFLALVAASAFLQLGTVWGEPLVQGTPVYPVTYLVTANDGFILAVIITAIYAGELVWRARQVGYAQLHDALPAREWVDVGSQAAALTLVQVALLLATVGIGLATQVLQGYYRFELGLYAREIFVLQFSTLAFYGVFALFVHTISPHKVLGHVLVVSLFLVGDALLTPLADRLHVTFPLNLVAFAGSPAYTYSDMSGYGPFAQPLMWFKTYWGLWAGVLGIGTVLFARRGTDVGWRLRWRQARGRVNARTVAALALLLAATTGAGGWIYYNARVLNAFVPTWTLNERSARFERNYKNTETIPQPRVTAVDVRVELYPSRGTYDASGTLTLQNKTSVPIEVIHVSGSRALRTLSFDRAVRSTLADTELFYWVHTLATPLAAGESIGLTFTAGLDAPGFKDADIPTAVVANGTFLDSSFMPTIGYDRQRELSDEAERRRQGLGARQHLPDPDVPGARDRQAFFPDSDWVSYRAIVGTEADQIAMTPGYLVREWQENGRRYFEYDQGPAKELKFFSYTSGRYAVRRDAWGDVNIEVYHHPIHTYNVDRMVAATRAGLSYFSQQFGPYQFRQFRVIEFPRYSLFAQSFANTVPFSEGLGFISAPTKAGERDYPFYLTLHELAHQWWGHQLVGAAAHGASMLSESLAEYSALMATEHEVGPAALRVYLKHDLDQYLRGRSAEATRERPLARSDAQYVVYQKGSLALYALKDYLGEAVVNAALRRFLDRFRFAGPPYPTTDDLIAELRAATPGDLQYLITDLFETITLYDNRAVEATWRPATGGKYAVTVKVQAGKMRADGEGRESPTPMNDFVDVGVFNGSGTAEKVLFLEKRRLTAGESTFEIVVDEAPSRAGIDPYSKLIDRVSDDNVIAITRAP